MPDAVLPRGRWDESLVHAAPTVAQPTEALTTHALRYIQYVPERADDNRFE